MPHLAETLMALAVALALAGALILAARRVPGARPALAPTLGGLGLWLAGAFVLADRGFFAAPDRFDLAADALGFAAFATAMTLPVAAILLAQARSPAFAALVAALPTRLLVGFQVYRLGGLAFAGLTLQGLVPPWFGWSTAALDVTVGLLALPVAIWGGRGAMLALSALGLADFAHAIGYVGASFLGVIAPDPAPAMIGLMPLALIALFQVPLAIALHWEVLRRVAPALSARRTTSAT